MARVVKNVVISMLTVILVFFAFSCGVKHSEKEKRFKLGIDSQLAREEKIQKTYLFSIINEKLEISKKKGIDLKCDFKEEDKRIFHSINIYNPKNYIQEKDRYICWSQKKKASDKVQVFFLIMEENRERIKLFSQKILETFKEKDFFHVLYSKFFYRFIKLEKVLPILASYHCGCRVTNEDMTLEKTDRNPRKKEAYIIKKKFYETKNGYYIQHDFTMQFSLKGRKISSYWEATGEKLYFKDKSIVWYVLKQVYDKGILYSIKRNALNLFKLLIRINPRMTDDYWSLLRDYKRFSFFKFLKERKFQFSIDYEQEYLLLRYKAGELKEKELVSILKKNEKLFYHKMKPFEQNFLMRTLQLELYSLSLVLLEAFDRDVRDKSVLNISDEKGRNALLITMENRYINLLLKVKIGILKDDELSFQEKYMVRESSKGVDLFRMKERYLLLLELLKYPIDLNNRDEKGDTVLDYVYRMFLWGKELKMPQVNTLKIYEILRKKGAKHGCEIRLNRCKKDCSLSEASFEFYFETTDCQKCKEVKTSCDVILLERNKPLKK